MSIALHATLLLRTVNKYQTKEEQLSEMMEYCSREDLIHYIEHFNDPSPETVWYMGHEQLENRKTREIKIQIADNEDGGYDIYFPENAPYGEADGFVLRNVTEESQNIYEVIGRLMMSFTKYPAWEDDTGYYTPCATNGDYSPSNPWDAPGMSIRDFI